MAKPFSERILDHMQQPDYRPMKPRRLARAMSIGEAEYGDFHEAVDALRRVGRVVLGTRNAVMLPHRAGHVTGTYRANPRGFGFVVPDEPSDHADLYISGDNAGGALTGDRVECTVIKRGKRDGKMMLGGKIERILERGESQFVGELQRDEENWYVKPDGNLLHMPIFIGDPGAKSARPGDQVVVEITQYPDKGVEARGVIVERLGERGGAGVDLLTVVRQYHIPDKFPEEVLSEVRAKVKAFDPEGAASGRKDLTGELIITIDPDDARDFDDAISLRRLSGKGKKKAVWELGVHIADVSAFVTPGSALDDEAVKRGTSVYLPGKVIPMLPEVLSNGLCSLQEGEPRLTKSAFMRYDAEGNVVDAQFANTVIRSTKRLTYGQATDIIEGREEGHAKPVIGLVKEMERLAIVIRKRRLRGGMIVLDLPSVDLILDEDGRVVDAKPEDTSFSHTIIEMCMVEANEAVARLMHGLKVPTLRRIHPEPDEDSLAAMSRFLKTSGMPMAKSVSTQNLQKLLERLRGQAEGYAVNLAVLKSMMMAEYSPKPIGHYALASDHYAHFTSPIRRYPDLMLHRLLDLYVAGELVRPKGGKTRHPGVVDVPELTEIGRQMSYLSRRAESAERELKMLKVLMLLEKEVGDTFDGIVTGVTNFGLFVQHPRYLVDGLLRFEDLGDDWWEADVKRGRVVGERSNTEYRLGSEVNVRIASVDLGTRQLDLGLVDSEGKKSGRKSSGKKGTSRKKGGASQPRSKRSAKHSKRRATTQKKGRPSKSKRKRKKG